LRKVTPGLQPFTPVMNCFEAAGRARTSDQTVNRRG
jgi:hypothetical protein